MKKLFFTIIFLAGWTWAEPEFLLVGVRSDMAPVKKLKVKEKLQELGVEVKPIKMTDGTNNWLIGNFYRQQLNDVVSDAKIAAITNAVADSAKLFVVATDDPVAVLNARGLK